MLVRSASDISDAILTGSWSGTLENAVRAGAGTPGGLPLPAALWIGGLSRMARGFNTSTRAPMVGSAFCRQAVEAAGHEEWQDSVALGSRIGVLVLNGFGECGSMSHIAGGVDQIVATLQGQHGLLNHVLPGNEPWQVWRGQGSKHATRKNAQVFLADDPVEIGHDIGGVLGRMGAAVRANGSKHGDAAFVVARLAMRGLGLDRSGRALAAAMDGCMDEARPEVLRAACMVGWMDGFCVMCAERCAVRQPPALDIRLAPEAVGWLIACSELDPMDENFTSSVVVKDMAQRLPWRVFRRVLDKSSAQWGVGEERRFRDSLAVAREWVSAWPVTVTPGRRFGIAGRDPRLGLETLDGLEQVLAMRKAKERLEHLDAIAPRYPRRMA